tara:strand:+ start:1097 stop:1372 length:276 start_codon:yes stop_codon:yes gene_type:complete
LRRNREQEFKLKKFIVPVNWQVSTSVVVEASDEYEAGQKAHDIHFDSMPKPVYVVDSFTVDYEVIEEAPFNKFDENAKGDFSTWDKMPGGF